MIAEYCAQINCLRNKDVFISNPDSSEIQSDNMTAYDSENFFFSSL